MRLMGELRTQGKTVVAVLHDLNQASRYCDQLVVMANGHVMAQGTPEEVMTPGLLRTVFSFFDVIYRMLTEYFQLNQIWRNDIAGRQTCSIWARIKLSHRNWRAWRVCTLPVNVWLLWAHVCLLVSAQDAG